MGKHHEHGSTLLLVLAILSVLALVAAGLAYTARIEGTASANYAQATQARIAASTGLPYAVSLLQSTSAEPVSTLQPWKQAPAALEQASRQSALGGRSATVGGAATASLYAKGLSDAGISDDMAGKVRAAGLPPANVTVTDLSGLVNVNAIRSDRALARVLEGALSGRAETKSASLDARSRAIIGLRRGGTEPGARQGRLTEAPTAELLDPRRNAPVDGTRRIESLGELARRGSGARSAIFTPAEVEALQNVLTVFSQAPEVYHRTDGTTVPKISLSALTADDTLAVLQEAFPDKDDRLLMQFAANVADALDDNRVPTVFSDGDSSDAHSMIMGVEAGMPFVTEVYPDSKTSEDFKDAGQFVEIHNPWPKPLLMAGWSLKIAGGASIPLNVVLPSGGFLVITDNYESPDKDAPPETGSLMSIFGTRADGAVRKIIEEKSLVLPDKDSDVRLLDDQGNLIDVFAWGSDADSDSLQSYQRSDPRVRAGEVMTAKPFELPQTQGGTDQKSMMAAFEEPKSFAPDENGRDSSRTRQYSGETTGTWLRSPVDLLAISTSYAALETDFRTGKSKVVSHSWQQADREIPEDEERTNLDLRVIDLFTTVKVSDADATGTAVHSGPKETASHRSRRGTAQEMRGNGRETVRGGSEHGASRSSGARGGHRAVGAAETADRKVAAQRIQAFRNGHTGSNPSASALGLAPTQETDATLAPLKKDDEATLSLPLLYSYGRLNLNTSSRIALSSLDGEVDGKDYLPAERLDEIESYRAESLKKGKTPFTNGSEFLTRLFPKAGEAELRAFALLLEQITVDSTSFRIVAENRTGGVVDPKRRTARAQLRWIIALDRTPFSLIDYAELP